MKTLKLLLAQLLIASICFAGSGEYEAPPSSGGVGSGDFVGPGSSVDNSIVRMDGTTGKLGQGSVVTIGDTGVTAGITDLSISRLAAGSTATLGASGGFDKFWHFSETITNFASASSWTGDLTTVLFNPSVDLTTAAGNAKFLWGSIYNTGVASGNVRNFEFTQGMSIDNSHNGSGTVEAMAGLYVTSYGKSSGDITTNIGEFVGAGHDGTGDIALNIGAYYKTGHSGAGGSITDDQTLVIDTPDHARPITNHYGLLIEDQEFGTNSWAIYSEGGKHWFKGNIGVGTGKEVPSTAIDVNGTVTATIFAGALSGNSSTATALAANGANCSAGSFPLGVDASGAVESCTVATTGTVTSVATGAGLTGGTITSTGTIAINYTDTLAGNPTLNAGESVFDSSDSNGGILFEGGTANTSEGLLTVATLTSDRTWTMPDVSGNLVSTGDTGTVTSTIVLDNTLGTADIDETAGYTWSGLVGVNTFASGAAITGSSYQAGRDADGTNQYHINVPTGATMEISVNDVAKAIFSTTGLSIGNAVAPSANFEISVAASSDPTFNILDGDQGHPITGSYPTTVVAATDVISSTNGGVRINGISDSNTTALHMRGLVGSSGAVGSAGAVIISGARSNGGTGLAALANTDAILRIENNGTVRGLWTGNGDFGINKIPAAGFDVAPAIKNASSQGGFNFTSAANTAQTATTEIPQSLWEFSTNTRQWATGTVALQRDYLVKGGVYSAVGASTFTRVSTFEIDSAPDMSTNATATQASVLTLASSGTAQVPTAAFNYQALNIPAHTLTLSGATPDVTNDGTTMVNIGQLTIANSTGAEQFTRSLASFSIDGPPIAGTNITFAAAAYSFSVDSGDSLFGGNVVLNDTNISNVGTIAADSINADATSVDYNDVNIVELTQADLTATCTLGQLRLDTGGAVKELCYCQATDTWVCTAMAAGPTD